MRLAFALAAVIAAGLLQQQPPLRGGTMEPRDQLQPLGAEPIEVLVQEQAWAGAEPLLQLATRHRDLRVRQAAVRALGRLEDPRIINQLLALPASLPRADAIAQSLYGFDAAADPAVIRVATEWMFDRGEIGINNDTLPIITGVAFPLSRIRFANAGDVHRVEAMLLKVMNFTAADYRRAAVYTSAIAAFEALARTNARVTPLEADSAERLKKAVQGLNVNDGDAARHYAFMALNSGRGLDADTVREALGDDYWQLRRVAATLVAGAGGGLDDQSRVDAIQKLLEDKSPQVRYEAVRAYPRRSVPTRGCGPLEDMTRDPDLHVALAAFDALGDACKDDVELTDRIAAEARVPPAVGSWHRETHAYVALAKRSPERAAPSMEAFVTHPVWWVRMYAAGAAAAAADLLRLEKLVYDGHDNVREAALGPWRQLKKGDADPALVDALGRTDVQLLRTTARLLKDSGKSERNYKALANALARLTKEGKETSRDARLALLDAMVVHGSRDDFMELTAYLKDFDPKVAERVAQIITGVSGKPAVAAPVTYPRARPLAFKDLRQCVALRLESGGSVRMRMEPSMAPVSVDRFLTLALTDHYYDGLTIHRIVPNFVIQAGSPNANEYSGTKEFLRDEVSGSNTRGTVGLSIRGRNTGDGQFYVNMVDNPRLDGGYTIFARILDMDVLDKVQEGEVIRSINPTKCENR